MRLKAKFYWWSLETTVLKKQLKELSECMLFDKLDDKSAQAYAVTTKNDIKLWQIRLGHADHDMIEALYKTTTGMTRVSKNIKEERYVDCLVGKIKRLLFPQKLDPRAIKPLQLVYLDLWRLMLVTFVR